MTMIIDPYTWHRLKIDDILRVGSDTVAVRFQRPTDYTFRPGQYAIVRATTDSDAALMRQYSFTSRPDDNILELLIQHEPEGEVSTWLCTIAKPGDEVELSQAFGAFTIDPAGKTPFLMIAGRVGIAPFLSMLRSFPDMDVQVLYSVSNAEQACFLDELATQNVTIIDTSKTGRINSENLAPYLAQKPLVYLCGSKQFVDAMTEYAANNHVDKSSIHRELFTLQ